jgi:hypothetical protein
MKLIKDFGVRALLASLALVAFEAIVLIVIVFLWRDKALTVEAATALVAAAQAPAMLAVGWYFGTRSGQPSDAKAKEGQPSSAPPEPTNTMTRTPPTPPQR